MFSGRFMTNYNKKLKKKSGINEHIYPYAVTPDLFSISFIYIIHYTI